GRGARGLHRADGGHRGPLGPRYATTERSADSNLAIGAGRFHGQRAFHCCLATWTSRCRCRAVVALSRKHGDSGARVVEGAHLPDAERRHRWRAGFGGADLSTIDRLRVCRRAEGWSYHLPSRGIVDNLRGGDFLTAILAVPQLHAHTPET